MADQFQSNVGSFVPTTNIWDVQQIYSTDVSSPEFKELLVRLYQNINNIALVLNVKDSGFYPLQEFLNGKIYFPNPLLTPTSSTQSTYRQEFRMVVNFGPLPNNATISIPHGIMIQEGFTFTEINGAATQTAPFSAISVLNPAIVIDVDDINVNITTTTDLSSYTNCILTLSYLKN